MPEPVLAGFAHGTSSPTGQRLVATLMDAVAAALPDRVTRLGFVDVQHPDIDETFDSVDAGSPVVAVPLLLSAGYHVHVDLHRAVGARSERPAALTGALGPDERLTAVLVHRLDEAGLRPDDALVLGVAGSSDRRAVVDCEVVAAQLAAATGHGVALGYLSAAELRLSDAVRAAGVSGRRVVVASYLLAPGYFHDLAIAAGADITTAPLLAAHDDPPQHLVDVIVDRYAEGVLALSASSTAQRVRPPSR